MISYVTSFEFQSLLALYVYWIPAVICLVVYLFRGVAFYKRDLTECSERYYKPELTIGVIIWWVICSLTPAVNVLALVFDCSSSVFKWLGQTLDMPLVRARNDK